MASGASNTWSSLDWALAPFSFRPDRLARFGCGLVYSVASHSFSCNWCWLSILLIIGPRRGSVRYAMIATHSTQTWFDKFFFKIITTRLKLAAGTVPYSAPRSFNTFSPPLASFSSTSTTIVRWTTSSLRSIWFCALSWASCRFCHKSKRGFRGPVYFRARWSHCTLSIWPGRLSPTIQMPNAILISSRPIQRAKSHSTKRASLDWSFGWSAFYTVHWNRHRRYPNWPCPI